jgi:hypothetical protein
MAALQLCESTGRAWRAAATCDALASLCRRGGDADGAARFEQAKAAWRERIVTAPRDATPIAPS